MKALLITFSGTHGTGKSTTAGICGYYLSRLGWKQSYMRQMNILIPFGFIIKRGSQILHLHPLELERTKPFQLLWAIYILLVYLPILGGMIRAKQTLGYSVLCDRYVCDLIVAFRGKNIVMPFENILPRLLPRPNISFVLEAPIDRILKSRPEHTQDFIEKELWTYSQLSKRFHLRELDASGPPANVGKEIVAQIESVIKAQSAKPVLRREDARR